MPAHCFEREINGGICPFSLRISVFYGLFCFSYFHTCKCYVSQYILHSPPEKDSCSVGKKKKKKSLSKDINIIKKMFRITHSSQQDIFWAFNINREFNF